MLSLIRQLNNLQFLSAHSFHFVNFFPLLPINILKTIQCSKTRSQFSFSEKIQMIKIRKSVLYFQQHKRPTSLMPSSFESSFLIVRLLHPSVRQILLAMALSYCRHKKDESGVERCNQKFLSRGGILFAH